LPALLAHGGLIEGPPERYLALVGLGGFGPMLAAMIAARIEGTGLKALLRPLGMWRVGVAWYLAALVLPRGIFVVAAAIWNTLGHAEPVLYPADNAAFLAAAIAFPIGEEVGWRGFALPRLTRSVGPLAASAVIGIVWTFWHVPMLTLQGVRPALYWRWSPSWWPAASSLPGSTGTRAAASCWPSSREQGPAKWTVAISWERTAPKAHSTSTRRGAARPFRPGTWCRFCCVPEPESWPARSTGCSSKQRAG
jgi:membrane protease YdiL (CAAX protease family)